MNNKKVLFFIVGVVLIFTIPFFLLNKNIKTLEEENKLLEDEINSLEKDKQDHKNEVEVVEVEKNNDESSEEENNSQEENNDESDKILNFSNTFVDLMFNRLNKEKINELKNLTEDEATKYLESKGYFKPVDDNSDIPESTVEEVKVYTRDLNENTKDAVIVYGTSVEDDEVINYGIYHLEIQIKDNGEVVATKMYGDNPLMNPDIELFFGKEAVDQ